MLTYEQYAKVMAEHGFTPEQAEVFWETKPEGSEARMTEDTFRMALKATRDYVANMIARKMALKPKPTIH